MESGVRDRLDERLRRVGGEEELAVAVLGRQRDVAGAVHDHIALRELRVVVAAVVQRHIVRAECERIAEVLHFGGEFLAAVALARADLGHVQFVRDALQHQAVRHVRADVTHADDADLRADSHFLFSSLMRL